MPKKYAVIESNQLRGRPLIIAKDLTISAARKLIRRQSEFSRFKPLSIVSMSKLKKIQAYHIFPKKLERTPSKRLFFGRKNR